MLLAVKSRRKTNMANLQKAVTVVVTINCDGTNGSFQLDLLKDPYFVIYQGGSNALLPVDWFTEDPLKSQPSGVIPGGSDSASLSNNIVSYTFATVPSAGLVTVEFQILFPA
jgi:hypothetical protein